MGYMATMESRIHRQLVVQKMNDKSLSLCSVWSCIYTERGGPVRFIDPAV